MATPLLPQKAEGSLSYDDFEATEADKADSGAVPPIDSKESDELLASANSDKKEESPHPDELRRQLDELKRQRDELFLKWKIADQNSQEDQRKRAEAESEAHFLSSQVDNLQSRLDVALSHGKETFEQTIEIAKERARERLLERAHTQLREDYEEGLKKVSRLLADLQMAQKQARSRAAQVDPREQPSSVALIEAPPQEEDDEICGWVILPNPEETPRPTDPAKILEELQHTASQLGVHDPCDFIARFSDGVVTVDELDFVVVSEDLEDYEFPSVWGRLYRKLNLCERTFDSMNSYWGRINKAKTAWEWGCWLVRYGGPVVGTLMWIL